MKTTRSRLSLFAAALPLLTAVTALPAQTGVELYEGTSARENYQRVEVVTNLGAFLLQLRGDVAPKTVENFLNYAGSGAYTNNFFHRSVPDFVVQGGGYFAVEDEEGGFDLHSVATDDPVENEFNLSNVRGTVAMAKLGGDPDSATSQWFVNVADNSANLDQQNGGFTVFAEVLGDGMEVVDAINDLPRWNFGGAFDSLPLIDYDGNEEVEFRNLALTRSVALADLEIVSNSNPDLVQATFDGHDLVLTAAADRSGSAEILVRTSGSELVVEETYLVTVREGPAPVAETFSALITGTELAGYQFLSSERFRRGEREGSWTYEKLDFETGRILLQFDDGEDEEITLAFSESGSVTLGGQTYALDFDFFGVAPATTRQRNSPWLGAYDQRHFDHDARRGWIRHEEHGWLYATGHGYAAGIWFWDHIQQDWLWTRADVYPFFFSHTRQEWLYYERGGTPQERWFYDYEKDDQELAKGWFPVES